MSNEVAKMQKKVTKMQILLQECILGEYLFRQRGWQLWAAPEPMRRKIFSEKLAISTHSIVDEPDDLTKAFKHAKYDA